MKKMGVWILIVLIIVIAVLVGVIAYNIIMNKGEVIMGEADLVNTIQENSSAVKELTVKYKMDSVTLIETDGDQIIVEEYMSHYSPDMNADSVLENGHLRITGGNRPIRIGINITYIKLYIPRDWAGELNLETSSGAVRTEDSWQFAEADFKSTSGSIRLQDVISKDKITISSTSGSVNAGALEADKSVSISSSSGSIRVEQAISNSREVAVSASSGRITLESAEGAKVEVSTSSGSIRIDRITDKNGGSSLSSSSGSITAEKLQTSGEMHIKQTSGSLRIGEAEGILRIKASSGSVTVGDTQGYGSIEGTSGRIQWVITELLGDVSVRSSSGSVSLTVPSKASFTAKLTTSSGSIRTDFGDELTYQSDKKTATAAIGDSPRHKVDLSATSGSVTVGRD